MSKLELEHIAKHLPYGLAFYMEISNRSLHWILHRDALVSVLENQNKPILRPLSYFYDKPKYGMINRFDIVENLLYWQVEKLIEDHADIDGLIEQGLAINVNALETNPYK